MMEGRFRLRTRSLLIETKRTDGAEVSYTVGCLGEIEREENKKDEQAWARQTLKGKDHGV